MTLHYWQKGARQPRRDLAPLELSEWRGWTGMVYWMAGLLGIGILVSIVVSLLR